MFGFGSPEEMVGLDPLDYIPAEDKGRIAGIMAGYFVEGDLQKTMDVRALAKDGREVWVTAVGVRTEHEEETAGLILMKDITAQKAAEKALAETEERQRQILDNANESIVVVQDGKIVFANRRTLELGGFSEEEMRGQSFMDFLCPEDREMMMRRYAKRVGGKEYPSSFQFKGIGRDGAVRWVEIRETSFAWEGKAALLCLLNDITEHRKAAEELAASERRYRLLADNVSDVIWVTDLQWKPTYYNPSVTHLLGYSVEEAMAGAVRMTPSSLRMATEKFREALAREEEQPGSASGSPMMELEFIDKKGSIVWAETTVSFLRDSKGHPYAVLGILHDVSERRKSEEALRRSEERFRALIENASDAIAVVSAEGEIVYESPSSQRAVEERISSLFGDRLIEVIHPDDVQKIIDLFERVRHRPGESTGDEVRYRHKDGSWHMAEGIARNLVNDPRVNGIVINYRDITERRTAEEALRESEKLYRLLAENLSDVIWVIGTDLRFTYVSPSVERLLGYSVEEAVALPVQQIVAPASFEIAMSLMAEEEAKERSGESDRERSVTRELELLRKDGSTVWTDNRVSYLRDSGGEVIGYLGVSRDIGERKKAEGALLASEERFRTIFERSPIGAIIYDSEGVAVGSNKACLEIFGLSDVADMKGPTLFDDPNLSDRAKQKLRMGTSVMGEGSLDLDKTRGTGLYNNARSGTVNLRLTVTPLGADKEGSPSGYLALVEDITERKKAEESLRASEERFRGLVETTSDWVWELDRKGVYTYASQKVSKVLGYGSEELLGKTPYDFMTQREARRVAAICYPFVSKQEPFAFLEKVCRHKDGHRVILETSGVPFLAPDGTLLGYRGIDRDITERKRVAKQLQQSLEKLGRTMEATIQAISTTIETRDPYTAGHQRRVTQLAGVIARDMSLPGAQIAGIRVAGLLHDIGKISVPTEILSKPGLLSDVEMSMIRTHPKIGYDILKNIEFEWPVAHIVIQHHERLDGSGYPSGIRGEKILLEARILAVADVVEAMSSHRPYRPAVGTEKALEEIARGDGTLYDPRVVRACQEAFTKNSFKFEE
jgi:PAS domain S-box-containing protein/putative nucleotidyltransferase with HDIG domain